VFGIGETGGTTMGTQRTRLRWALLLTCALAVLVAIAPGASADRDDDDRLMRMVDRMSLEEKVGQMFMTYAYGTDADDADPRNQTEYGVDNHRQLIERYHLGGIIYFAWSGNVQNPRQIAGLSNGIQRAATSSGAEVPALISTDQEQGLVVRITEPATQFRATWRSAPRATPGWRRPPPRSRGRSSARWGSTRTSRRSPT
jgi:beta-N-acetylhexosaminidase